MFHRKCKITYIAHGATIYSEENQISFKENYPPLSEAGEQEIENVCEWLTKRTIKNDIIYTSSALKTTQSAQIIAKALKQDFKIIDDLSLKKDEAPLELNKRVSKEIKNIVDKNIGNRIIIVTHPTIIQAAIASAIKLSADYQSNIYIKTGSTSQISYFESWSSLMYSGLTPM